MTIDPRREDNVRSVGRELVQLGRHVMAKGLQAAADGPQSIVQKMAAVMIFRFDADEVESHVLATVRVMVVS